MNFVATFLRLAKQAFLNIAIALILFFVLIELTFYLSSWILYMPAFDIVKEVAMMIVLMSVVSASLALLVAAIGCVLTVPWAHTRTKRVIEEAIYALVAIGSLAMIAVAVLVVDRYVIRREEAYLEMKFGAGYLDYKRRVRRWL